MAVRAGRVERDAVLHRAGARGAGLHGVVTLLAADHVPTEAYEAVAQYFSEDEVAALIGLIVTINAWNAISVSTRAWEPGSYEP